MIRSQGYPHTDKYIASKLSWNFLNEPILLFQSNYYKKHNQSFEFHQTTKPFDKLSPWCQGVFVKEVLMN